LNYSGAITHNPNEFSSIKKIKHAQETLVKNNVKCIFKEPQFSNAMIDTIAQDKKIHIGILDPLGGTLGAGKTHYFDLMNNIKKNLIKCLENN
jgi:zinc transport system substrate-binding protein